MTLVVMLGTQDMAARALDFATGELLITLKMLLTMGTRELELFHKRLGWWPKHALTSVTAQRSKTTLLPIFNAK